MPLETYAVHLSAQRAPQRACGAPVARGRRQGRQRRPATHNGHLECLSVAKSGRRRSLKLRDVPTGNLAL